MSRSIGGRVLEKACIVRKINFNSLQAYASYVKVFTTELAEVLPPTVNEDGSISVIIFDQYNKTPMIKPDELFDEIWDSYNPDIFNIDPEEVETGE